MDQIKETNETVEEFLKFGLQGPCRYISFGEKYLRLIGFLNIIYLQSKAILALATIFDIKNIKEIKNKFKETSLIKMRNQIGSHVIDYSDQENKKNCYTVSYNLHDENINYVNYSNDEKGYAYNIFDECNKYYSLALECLDLITYKIVKTCYKTSKKKYNEWVEKLKDYKQIANGTMIINSDGDNKIKVLVPKEFLPDL